MIMKYCEYCHKVMPYEHECTKKIKYTSTEKKTNPFYLSKQWTDKREHIKRKCFGLDVYDLIVNHTVTYGRIVHHIVPLNDNQHLKLSDSNLIFLSDSNHQLIHEMLNQNYISTINMLTECLKKFEEIFGTGGI